jgi:hypothetical protein
VGVTGRTRKKESREEKSEEQGRDDDDEEEEEEETDIWILRDEKQTNTLSMQRTVA